MSLQNGDENVVNYFVQFFTTLQVECLNELIAEMISNLNFGISTNTSTMRWFIRRREMESCIKDLQVGGFVRRYDAEYKNNTPGNPNNETGHYNWLLSNRALYYVKFQLAKINNLPFEFDITGWKKEPRPLCPREFEQLKSGTLKMD